RPNALSPKPRRTTRLRWAAAAWVAWAAWAAWTCDVRARSAARRTVRRPPRHLEGTASAVPFYLQRRCAPRAGFSLVTAGRGTFDAAPWLPADPRPAKAHRCP